MTGGTPVPADVDADHAAAKYTAEQLVCIQNELLNVGLPLADVVNGWFSAMVHLLRTAGLHDVGAAALRLAADDLDAERRRGAN